MKVTQFKKFPYGTSFTVKRIVKGFECWSNYLCQVEGKKFFETSTEHHADKFSSDEADQLINLLSN